MPAILAAQWLPRERIHPSGQISGRPVANRSALAQVRAISVGFSASTTGPPYVDNGGRLLTSAGLAVGLDMCLHMVASDHGAAVAAATARPQLVVSGSVIPVSAHWSVLRFEERCGPLAGTRQGCRPAPR